MKTATTTDVQTSEQEGITMNTITSMDGLKALDVGVVVAVNNSRWVITSEGAQRGEFSVSLDDLVGYVNAGTMTVGISPQSGEVWVNGRFVYQLLVRDPYDQTKFWAARYSDDRFDRVDRVEPMDHWEPGGPEKPSYMTTADFMYQQLLVEEKINLDRLTRQAETTRAESRRLRDSSRVAVSEFSNRLETDLHKWMEENDHGHRSDLADILELHGIDRPPPDKENVSIEVNFSGHHAIYFDEEDLQASLNASLGCDGVVVDSGDEVSVGWTLTISTVREVDEGSCACEDFGQSDLRELLDDNGYEAIESFDWEINCSND